MSKSLFVVVLLLLLIKSGFSEDTLRVSKSSRKVPVMGLALNLNNCFLNNQPGDLNLKVFSPGADVFVAYNASLVSGLCVSVGAGFSSQNYNYNVSPLNYNVDVQGNTHLVKIPDSISFSVNKISLSYVEVPLELKYFANTSNSLKSVKAAIGMRFGYLIDSHTKYKSSYEGIVTTSKINKIKNIEDIRYGITARVSKGPVGAYGYYALSNLFTNKVFMNGKKVSNLSAFTLGFSLSLD